MFNEAPYVDFVMNEAIKKGKIFIIDSGEGHDCIDESTGWYIEDFSGWLILKEQEKAFQKAQDENNAYELFGNEYVFAKWFKNDDSTLRIEFIKYPSY